MADGPKAGSSSRRAQVWNGGSELIGGTGITSFRGTSSGDTTAMSRDENRSTSWAIAERSSYRTGSHVRWRRSVNAMGHHSRSEEHTSELQSLMRISYAVFCLKKKKTTYNTSQSQHAELSQMKIH